MFIKKFNTIKEAADEIGKTKCSGISACCKNKQKSAYGYIWSYYFKNNIDSYNVKTKEKKVEVKEEKVEVEAVKEDIVEDSFIEETRFEVKPTLWERIKNSKRKSTRKSYSNTNG